LSDSGPQAKRLTVWSIDSQKWGQLTSSTTCFDRCLAGKERSIAHTHSHDDVPAQSPLVLFRGPLICLIGLIAGWLTERGLAHVDSSASTSRSLLIVLAGGLYLIAYVGGGWQTTRIAWQSLMHRELNIDVLMLLAAGGSALLGEFAEGAVLLFLFSLSHALESYILGHTRNAIRGLMELTPDVACVIRDRAEVSVAVDQVAVGDVILIRPAERVPLDGLVESGQSSVNEAPMTGESLPVDKVRGDRVLAGSLNLDGVLTVRVQRAVNDTTLSRMVELVKHAQSAAANSERFTDWFGSRYPWVVIAASSLTFGLSAWYHADFTVAFYDAMTLLVVASPCAVVISIPAAILTAIASGARAGVLVKGGIHLETLAKVTAIALDKTGTLTLGQPQIVDTILAPDVDPEDLLSVTAALERDSEHPLARAFVSMATVQGLSIPTAASMQVIVAKGIMGEIWDETVRVGKVPWLVTAVCEPPPNLAAAIEAAGTLGQTVVGVTRANAWLGIFGISDTVRPTSRGAIAELRDLGISKIVMLTGDQPAAAARIAEPLGLDFMAGLLPAEKLDCLESWKKNGEVTAMVGDGMNDAPALATADLGISLGGAATDVALETADVVVMADDLRRLPFAIRLARKTQSLIRQNLTLAFGTMLVLLVISRFVTLPLPIAVLGHEGSTVLVILNGLRVLGMRYSTPGHSHQELL
jgi:Cd2+/Zn2+-exporting ATPase